MAEEKEINEELKLITVKLGRTLEELKKDYKSVTNSKYKIIDSIIRYSYPIIVALAAWVGNTIINYGERIAIIESNYINTMEIQKNFSVENTKILENLQNLRKDVNQHIIEMPPSFLLSSIKKLEDSNEKLSNKIDELEKIIRDK